MTSRQVEVVPRVALSPAEFIAWHPVFRVEELSDWYREAGRGDGRQVERLLEYYVREEKLQLIKRGVYAQTQVFDEWLIASRLTPDAVIGFDGALAMRGLIGEGHRVCYLTSLRTRPFCFNETIFQPVRANPFEGGEETMERAGLPVRITSLERTFVDCTERLNLGPELHELVGAFARAKELNVDEVARLAAQRRSQLLMSRLGFCLMATGRSLPREGLRLLLRGALKRPDYFARAARRRGDRIIAKWNLIVSPEQDTMYKRGDGAATFHEYAQPRGY